MAAHTQGQRLADVQGGRGGERAHHFGSTEKGLSRNP